MDKFPIKYRNFSKNINIIKVTNVGFTDIDFGFDKLTNVQIRLIEYPKFKMIELKKRDFRIAIGTNGEGTILLNSNDLFEYEISKNIKNNRLGYILEFFINLFSGSSIKFHLSNVVCDIDFMNRIEAFKFTNILETLNAYEELVKVYNLSRNKELAASECSFYPIFLLAKELHKQHIDTWINLEVEKPSELSIGDKLILNRIHKFNFKNFPFSLVEKIEVKNPLNQNEILDNKIKLNKKTVKISFEKIKKQ